MNESTLSLTSWLKTNKMNDRNQLYPKPLVWTFALLIVVLAVLSGFDSCLKMINEGTSTCMAVVYMIIRIVVAIVLIGVIAYFVFYWLIPETIDLFQKIRHVRQKKLEGEVARQTIDTTQTEGKDNAEAELRERKEQALYEINSYAKATFEPLLNNEQIEKLLNNIEQLSLCGKYQEMETAKLPVTALDLFHFGHNIFSRLQEVCTTKPSRINTADFLKTTFCFTLAKNDINTIVRKLTGTDGKYTLKVIPKEEPLVPHVWPELQKPDNQK